MGEWDMEAIRTLFTSLEFRTLYERLEEVGRSVKPAVEVAELDLREASADEVAGLLASDAPKAVRLHLDGGQIRGVAVSAGGGQAAYAAFDGPASVLGALADPASPKWAHDAKTRRDGGARRRRGARRRDGGHDARRVPARPGGAELRPRTARRAIPRDGCPRRGGRGGRGSAVRGVVASDRRRGGRRRAARARDLRTARQGGPADAPRRRGAAAVVRAGADAGARRRDWTSATWTRWRAMFATGWRRCRRRSTGRPARSSISTRHRSCARSCTRSSRLSPGKKTSKGQLSTDASVLEKLRDAHPIVDALLQWRELDKLNSTYLEALPRQVDPRDGRVHTTFNQTGAATGRLSSVEPEPAEHPDPRRARPADPPGVRPRLRGSAAARRRLLADRAPDPGAPRRGTKGLKAAFASGADIHTATSAQGVRPARRPGRPGDPESREGDQLRARVRDERVGPRLAPGDHGRRGAGVHRRVLRELPADPRVPGPSGSPRDGRGLHGDDPRAPALHPRAPGLEPARAGHGSPDGSERPDPGQRRRRVQARDDPGGRGPASLGSRTATCCSPCTTSSCSRWPGTGSRRPPPWSRPRWKPPTSSGPAAGRHRLGTELGRGGAGRPLTRPLTAFPLLTYHP